MFQSNIHYNIYFVKFDKCVPYEHFSKLEVSHYGNKVTGDR